jgi:hypothetical protein
MSEYQLVVTYLSALVGRFRDDERGIADNIVWIGITIIAAGVIAGILYAKLKDGANHVSVPAPQAP